MFFSSSLYQYFKKKKLWTAMCKHTKLFLSDVDGVLTDGGKYYSESGDELKKFNTRDGMAFGILQEHGIKTGIITSENTNIVANRAKKLKLDFCYRKRLIETCSQTG